MGAPRIFDGHHYELLNRARGDVVARLLAELKPKLGLQTAIDVGCGLGHFAGLLSSLGFTVTAVDGRLENLEEARRRHPGVRFCHFDAQDSALRSLGKFDLVFCFGLLYHLENPLGAIRHLHYLAGKFLLAESVIYPGSEPVLALIDEEIHEDQGLNHLAFYPTESCLTKMLYRAGFRHAYTMRKEPDHPDYRSAAQRRRVRTMLAASHHPVSSHELVDAPETSSPIRPWDAQDNSAAVGAVQKLQRFAEKPLPDKLKALGRIVRRRRK